jgi:pyruvate dehydrogenase E2 component (dihydrolipoamide acetyltransferase)
MVIKACAMALKRHPKVNSQWKEEAITINHHVSIGVAVAVEDGLVVPVLKFTDAMSLSQIGGSVRDLAGRAKTKNYYQPKWKEVLLPFLTLCLV